MAHGDFSYTAPASLVCDTIIVSMIGHFFAEVLAIIFGFIRSVVEIFIQALQSAQGIFILALLVAVVGSTFAFLSPDLTFLGVPGLVHISDLSGISLYALFTGILTSLLYLFLSLWWLWLFFLLFEPTRQLWIHWRQELFKAGTKWILWELRMPRLVTQTPEAMDQVFASLHALRNSAGNLAETYIDGEITRWFTFEMVSFAGEVKFYLRAYSKQKDLIESAFFSYYPDVEMVVVTDDYLNKMPKNMTDMYAQNLDIWGSEMSLTKEEAYPIKTYPNFETPDPEKRLDPISTFLELLGKLKPGEFVGIQFLLAPADKSWFKKYSDLIKKLKKPEEDKQDEKTGKFSFNIRTPGETEVLEAVEHNLSKPAFDTVIRFLYYSPKESYLDTFPRRGITGAFNQYGLLDLNSFGRNEGMSTRAQVWDYPHIFPAIRTEYRKQRLLQLYRDREIPPETSWGKWYVSHPFNSGRHTRFFKLNTEALATLFHPPTEFVLTAPHVKRVESRKAGAPAGLAIFAEEEALDKFYPEGK